VVTSRTIIVVGNSDGIGLGLTRLLLERGYRVEGLSRSASSVQHPNYRHTVIDVTAADYVEVLERIVVEAGNVAAAVYCAGIGERTTPETLALDLHVFDVNLMGAIRTAQVVLPVMCRANEGRFIVLSSQADVIVSHEASSYAASKAALSSYFEGLGLKLRKSPVRICNVRFGFVDTKMARAGIQPFRIAVEKAAGLLLRLVEGRCPRRVTCPRRMAVVVAALALVQRLRVLCG
jgi:short-subunit dehydrogenase